MSYSYYELSFHYFDFNISFTPIEAKTNTKISKISYICKLPNFTRMNPLDNQIQYLPGIGPTRAKFLSKELGINTVGDMIRFYPFRYIDRCSITPIVQITPDAAYVQVQAKVLKVNTVPGKRINAIIEDATGEMEIVFFRGLKWISDKLRPGMEFIFFGKPTVFNGKFSMTHPEIDPVQSSETNATSGMMTGIYNSTEKLRNSGISNKVMIKLMHNALKTGLPAVTESLPEYVITAKKLLPLRDALKNIHFPTDAKILERARYRLKFEELFLLQLSLLKQKYIRRHAEAGIVMPKVGEAFNKCYESIPFELTGAQKRVIKEIREDMRGGQQMNRLLQGDVGSGKTMVAVLCALIAIGNGYQTCIMAPTEVLARQHFSNISKYLAPTGVRAAILTGSSKTAERRDIHAGLEDGSIGIIVGTHALLEDNVIFKNLGMAIIDEQHRFGVAQRSRLWSKAAGNKLPHVLVMTATPIPRTLAMTLFGDLDISVIDEMPPGRKPILTMHATEGKRSALFKFMRDQIALGRQIFVVYPLIFESEKLDYKNLEEGCEQIMKAFPFPNYKVAIVHGQQATDVKQFNMDAFVAGRADILVATSVIEVGVDVPNASVMVIESAERFGLSQLHQLRGRVGRGSEKSYCILMTGNKVGKESLHRIEMMCKTENGFELAEEDMKMRGPGDLEGTQQSGLPISLNIASLSKDGLILSEARKFADHILDKDPLLSHPENRLLATELTKAKYKIEDYSKIS